MAQFVIASELASIFTSPNFSSNLRKTNFFYYLWVFLRDSSVNNLMECFLIEVIALKQKLNENFALQIVKILVDVETPNSNCS